MQCLFIDLKYLKMFTDREAKVMFSQACASHSVHREAGVFQHAPGQGVYPSMDLGRRVYGSIQLGRRDEDWGMSTGYGVLTAGVCRQGCVWTGGFTLSASSPLLPRYSRYASYWNTFLFISKIKTQEIFKLFHETSSDFEQSCCKLLCSLNEKNNTLIMLTYIVHYYITWQILYYQY